MMYHAKDMLKHAIDHNIIHKCTVNKVVLDIVEEEYRKNVGVLKGKTVRRPDHETSTDNDLGQKDIKKSPSHVFMYVDTMEVCGIKFLVTTRTI